VTTTATGPREERHYAVTRLEEAAREIKQHCQELPDFRQKLEKYREKAPEKAKEVYAHLQKLQRRAVDALVRCRLSLLEMELEQPAAYAVKLAAAVQNFNLLTPDYTKFTQILGGFAAQIPQQTANAAAIGHLMNNVKMGYYPTDLDHIKQIAAGIAFPDGVTTNLLDPCCGCGLGLRTLAQGNNCYAYGIELDEYRAQEAQTRLHRVSFGSYFHSRVSHEAFHVLFLNPPYLSVIGENGSRTRHEKRFLIDSMVHLMPGGLLIYIIPYYRLTADICRVLADNFSDLTVWKFSGREFKRLRQIAVLGLRQKRADGSALVNGLSQNALFPERIPELSALPANRYAIPGTPVSVPLFKGAKFNEAELAEQLKKSTSFAKLFEKNQLDGFGKRPLLPLGIGQIGLIGGSGLINGLIDCDTPHLIKGRIVKTARMEETKHTNDRGEHISSEVREIISNKMIFNLLTPDGFQSLT